MRVKVKNMKGRTTSSTGWLRRALNDQYSTRASQDGYRSRSAYKLLQINDKFNLIKSRDIVVDLGSSPGGWSQVVASKLGKYGKVVAVDQSQMEPIYGVQFVHCSFPEGLEMIEDALGNKKRAVDIVLSDIAPSSCGDSNIDHIRLMEICERTMDFAYQNLRNDGSFVCKILRGGLEQDFCNALKSRFAKVKYFKPGASHASSAEIYVVAMGFQSDTTYSK